MLAPCRRPARTLQVNDLVVLDRRVRVTGQVQQVIDAVTDVQPAVAPVPGHRDLVDDATGDAQRAHAVGDLGPRLDFARAVTTSASRRPRSHGRRRGSDRARRTSRAVAPSATAASGSCPRRVVLGQPEGRHHDSASAGPPVGWYGFSGRSQRIATGLEPSAGYRRLGTGDSTARSAWAADRRAGRCGVYSQPGRRPSS